MGITAQQTRLCKFMKAVEELKALPGYDADDAADIHEWFNGDVPAAVIGRTLRAAAHIHKSHRLYVSTTTIKQHRLNDCGCKAGI